MAADAPIPARLVTIYTLVASPKRPPWEVALAADLARQALDEGQTRPGSYRHFHVYRHGKPYPRLAAEGLIGEYDVEEIATILTKEQGKTLLESRLEARRFGENIGWFADLADKMSDIWRDAAPGPDSELEQQARADLPRRVSRFAESFVTVAHEAVEDG